MAQAPCCHERHLCTHGFAREPHGAAVFASASRAQNIARARELIAAPKPHNDPADDGSSDGSEPQAHSYPCPCCGGHMIIIETFERNGSPRYRPTAPMVAIRIDTS